MHSIRCILIKLGFHVKVSYILLRGVLCVPYTHTKKKRYKTYLFYTETNIMVYTYVKGILCVLCIGSVFKHSLVDIDTLRLQYAIQILYETYIV